MSRRGKILNEWYAVCNIRNVLVVLPSVIRGNGSSRGGIRGNEIRKGLERENRTVQYWSLL
jgi:hypothetical protein